MMVSTKGRYALRVMLDLAQHQGDSFVPLKAIAGRQEISMKYLETIVAMLHKGGLIQSLRGKDGGYRLAQPPECYTVGRVLKLTEGSLAPVACGECGGNNGKGKSCGRAESCLTLPLWNRLDSLIDGFLENVTLADLLEQRV